MLALVPPGVSLVMGRGVLSSSRIETPEQSQPCDDGDFVTGRLLGGGECRSVAIQKQLFGVQARAANCVCNGLLLTALHVSLVFQSVVVRVAKFEC